MDHVLKFDDEKQYVFGWASIAVRRDGTQLEDHQGDIIDPDDLENAAYQFVLNYRETGEMHKGAAVGTLIESCVITKAKLDAWGLAPDALPLGMWVGFYIESPDVFAKIKNGDYAMFSIQGVAIREEVA